MHHGMYVSWFTLILYLIDMCGVLSLVIAKGASLNNLMHVCLHICRDKFMEVELPGQSMCTVSI